MPDENKLDTMARVARVGYVPQGDEASASMFARSNQGAKLRKKTPKEALGVLKDNATEISQNVFDLAERERQRQTKRSPVRKVAPPARNRPQLKRAKAKR
jgi:hypothetical protein